MDRGLGFGLSPTGRGEVRRNCWRSSSVGAERQILLRTFSVLVGIGGKDFIPRLARSEQFICDLNLLSVELCVRDLHHLGRIRASSHHGNHYELGCGSNFTGGVVHRTRAVAEEVFNAVFFRSPGQLDVDFAVLSFWRRLLCSSSRGRSDNEEGQGVQEGTCGSS